MEEFDSAVHERETSIPSPPPEKDADRDYSPLSEFKRADRTGFSRSMHLNSSSDSSLEYSSLNLDAKLLSDIDCRDAQKAPPVVSSKNCVETRQSVHPLSAANLTHHPDFLDKPRVDIETRLIDFVCNDNAEGLVCLLRKIAQGLKFDKKDRDQEAQNFEAFLSFWFPHRLLQLACQLDSVACAEALLEGETGLSSPVNAVDEGGKTALHYAASNLSFRCIELLLRKRAKTDLSSNDGCIPLQSALQSKRWHTNSQALPAVDIIRTLRTQDVTIVKLLASHTKDVLRLACHLAFDGDAAALTALILAAGQTLLGEEHKYESFLDLVVEKALSSGRGNLAHQKFWKGSTKTWDPNDDECEAQRSSILKSLEIIVRLKGELACSPSHLSCETQRNKPSALLRAAQAGDEVVISILLNNLTNVNETDSDGNTALHWCLKTTKGLRIVWNLIAHGSAVGARNTLGLTPIHIAAGQGHFQALQVLLAQDPDAVHIASVTKETPLFLAAKNDHIECVKLLLQFGSNSQALNLRRQRPIDFASSQDMRMILSQNGTGKVKANPDFKYHNSTSHKHQPQTECGPPSLENGTKFDIKIDRFINSQDDLDESNWLLRTQAKTALCRYHMMPGGCARGDGCFYAHGEQELRPEAQEKCTQAKVMDVLDPRKIFVGGLSPAMGSDDLKNYFEAEFGPIEEAIVMSSQNGGHIQSRGFGFVTFKKEASCIAAVKQHYLTIYGKRVEIKAAFQSSKKTDEMLNIHLSDPPGLVHSHEISKDEKWSGMSTSSVLQRQTAATSKAETAALTPPRKCSPPWLAVFKKWLPAFLSVVSKRQRGAECYPLSSVKADFRATCGMELDHVALGFPKLSDFLRTMPELCRMKIVPVGRGPATHVVLQVRQQSLVEKSRQPITATKILTSSMVHEGRTYAAAAGHNTGTPEKMKAEEIKNSEDAVLIESQPVTSRNYNGQQQEIFDSKISSFFSTSDTVEPQHIHTEKMATVDTVTARPQGLAGNNLGSQSLQPQLMYGSMTNEQFRSVTPEASATQPPHQQNILSFLDKYENPYLEQMIPFSSFPNRAVPSFRRDAVPFYNPWNFNSFEGCRNLIQQMNLAATGEESPQSSLTSEDSLNSPLQLPESPPHPCVICGDKAAVWVALPCAHKVICSPCKHQLHKRNQSLQQCLICKGRTREWMAQYY